MKGLPVCVCGGGSWWAVSMSWQVQEVLSRPRQHPPAWLPHCPASSHQHLHFLLGVFSLPTSVPSAVKGRREGWAIDAAAPNSHQPVTGRRWSINAPSPSPVGKTTLRCGFHTPELPWEPSAPVTHGTGGKKYPLLPAFPFLCHSSHFRIFFTSCSNPDACFRVGFQVNVH